MRTARVWPGRPGNLPAASEGKTLFFRTRDTSELIDVLGGWRGVSVLPAMKDPADFARDRSQEAEDTSDWVSSIAPDLIPGDEEPAASVASDPVPKFKKPAALIAPDPIPEDQEPPVPLASLAPDPRGRGERLGRPTRTVTATRTGLLECDARQISPEADAHPDKEKEGHRSQPRRHPPPKPKRSQASRKGEVDANGQPDQPETD